MHENVYDKITSDRYDQLFSHVKYKTKFPVQNINGDIVSVDYPVNEEFDVIYLQAYENVCTNEYAIRNRFLSI